MRIEEALLGEGKWSKRWKIKQCEGEDKCHTLLMWGFPLCAVITVNE